MGDAPPGMTPQSLDTTTDAPVREEHQGSNFKATRNASPFQPQLGPISQPHVRPDLRSPGHPTSNHYPLQEHGASSLNMGQMAGALPDYSSLEVTPHQHIQRPLSGASTSALVYQLQQNLQMPGHGSNTLPQQSGYAQGQYQQNFAHGQGHQPAYGAFHPNQRLPHPNSMQTPYQNFHQASQYMYYPSPYGPQGQLPHTFQAQTAHSQPMYGRRPSLTTGGMPLMGQNIDFGSNEAAYAQGGRLVPTGALGEPTPGAPVLSGTFGAQGTQRSAPLSTVPRGPPRKPKQSGHALWVGNLPPGTTVVALKDHFSRDATKDIESLFLISKSNCAFVNYRTEASCTAAMHRFHDSRFNGVRLVCRLRRSSAPASGVPTGPSAMVDQPPNISPPRSPKDADAVDGQVDGEEPLVGHGAEDRKQSSNAKERYFIVKSLTLQDLESSVRNGIWATQSHNEETLNKAFESADNVYLIFSANKSGEYFGYARMASPILEDAKSVIDTTPKPNIVDAPDVPKSIPTPATEFAPRGRIIDDSARGTIFWEADLSDTEEHDVEISKEEPQVDGDAAGVPQSWGKPFRVEWLSTSRLPFYRTRGLRNPWNANREVKIARDGTELETSVGERLLQMFHRLGPPTGPVPMSGPMMAPPHLGPPQMRPY